MHRAETWLALAASEPDRARARRIGLGAAAAVVALLGVVGWLQVDAQDPTAELDTLAVLYRTFALFFADGSGAGDVPVALDAARLLAPVVSASAAIGVVLGALEARLHRRAAIGSHEHRLVVGPVARAKPYCAEAGRLVVHADVDTHRPEPRTVSTHVDLTSAGWLRDTGARRAAEVVLATGDDQRNVELLGDLDAAGVPAVVGIEIDDDATAGWLAIALATRSPERDVAVLSPALELADAVRDEVLRVIDPELPRAVVALVGDGGLPELVCSAVVEGLAEAQAASDGLAVPTVVLVAPDAALLADRLDDRPHRVVVHAAGSVEGLEQVGVDLDLAVLVGGDATRWLLDALQLRARWPAARIVTPMAHGVAAAGLDVLGGRARARDLHGGPFAAAARARYDDDRTGTVDPSWDDLPEGDRHAAIRDLRRLAAGLVDAGLVLSPALGGATVAFLPAELCRRLDPASGGGDLAALPFWLRAGGLALDDELDLHSTPGPLPDPAVIEALAQAAHASYVAIHGGHGWAEAEPVDQASNRDQARHALVGLHRLGYAVVPRGAAAALDVLPDDDVRTLARREHDRWAELKRAHGWRHRPERDDEQRHHPDLVAWDDLTRAAQEKDEEPMGELVARLRAVGYAVVRAADAAV